MEKSHKLKISSKIDVFDAMGNLKQTKVVNLPNKAENLIKTELYDRKDRLIKEQERPFRSFTKYFAFGFAGNFRAAPYTITKFAGGTAAYGATGSATFTMNAGYNNIASGIVLGSSNAALAITDTSLGTLINTDTIGSSGTLYYKSNVTAVDEALGTFRLVRGFENISGSPISVEECGIHANNIALIARDLLSETIPDGGTMAVLYTFNFPESSGFNRNWVRCLRYYADNGYAYLYRTSSGVSTSFADEGFYMKDTSSLRYGGIVVGSGTKAIDMDDFNLETLITNGTGTGNLSYQNNQFSIPGESGSKYLWQVDRAFYNLSGGDVTINEVGMYGIYDNSNIYAMHIRYLVGGSGVTIPDGGSSSVTITFEIDVNE